MSDHSAAAALFGICECRECSQANQDSETDDVPRIENTDDWHLWCIRSFDLLAIRRHRTNMIGMGFAVESIENSRGWKEDCLPRGMFYFKARILKNALSQSDFMRLVEWDRLHDGAALQAAKGGGDV